MKRIIALVFSSMLFFLLTGCAPVHSENSIEPANVFGVTGSDISAKYKVGDLEVYDQLMFEACKQLFAYSENQVESDSGQVSTLKGDEGAKLLRKSALPKLEKLAEFVPSSEQFILGVKKELESPGSKSTEFLAFIEMCKAYKQVQKNIQANYLPPTKIKVGCYNISKVRVFLQEDINGYWKDLGEKPHLSKVSWCKGRYQYGASFTTPRYRSDEDRIIRADYVSWGNFSDGTRYKFSSEEAFTPDMDEIFLDSGW